MRPGDVVSASPQEKRVIQHRRMFTQFYHRAAKVMKISKKLARLKIKNKRHNGA